MVFGRNHQIGFLILNPGRSQAGPVFQLIVQIDQAVEHQGSYGAASGVGAQDRVQDLRIRRGPVDIFDQSGRIAHSLLIVGGNPEK